MIMKIGKLIITCWYRRIVVCLGRHSWFLVLCRSRCQQAYVYPCCVRLCSWLVRGCWINSHHLCLSPCHNTAHTANGTGTTLETTQLNKIFRSSKCKEHEQKQAGRNRTRMTRPTGSSSSGGCSSSMLELIKWQSIFLVKAIEQSIF